MPALRNAYFVLAALTLLLVTAQFLVAGLLIFENRDDYIGAHGALAGVLHLLPLLMIVAALGGRMGRDAALYAVVLLVLVTVQSAIQGMDNIVASLHPIVALVIFVIAHMAFQRSRAWKATAPPAPTAPAA